MIAVLNAGSSSIKFSLFDEQLKLAVRGQVEGIYTSPHFVARDAGGKTAAEERWPEGAQLGHAGALDAIVAFVRECLRGGRLAGIGHRVVHGGMEYPRPVRMDRSILQALRKFEPLAPLHQPHNLAPIELLFERLPA